MNQRRALWLALADLFLDTEVRWFLPGAAFCAVQSGFSWAETEHILYHEVGPVVGGNLLSVAGEWAGWDSEHLCRSIEEHRKGLLDTPRALLLKLHFGDLSLGLRGLYDYFSTTGEADELPRLEVMAHLYIDKDWTRQISLWSHLRKLEWWSEERLRHSWERGVEPVYRDLVYPGRVATDASPRQARANWQWYLDFLHWAGQQGLERSRVLGACEELSYLFTVEKLASTPRAEMMREALKDFPRDVLHEFWQGPLSLLYGRSPGKDSRVQRAACNWDNLWI